MTAVAAVLAVGLMWSLLRLRASPEPEVPTRAEIRGLELPGFPEAAHLAISADGRQIVAAQSDDEGERALYLREAADLEWRRLPNTNGASNPSFSPDGRWVAFDADGAIRKVPITNGPALPIANGFDPHWGLSDVIVYDVGGGLHRVDASGDEPEVLFESDTIRVRRPHLLPNGRAVVFGTATGGDPLTGRILVFDIGEGEVRELVASGNHPRSVPTGHLVYGHGEGALMAVAFDLETLRTTGSPVPLVTDLTVFARGASEFAVSETGTLVYRTGPANRSVTPVWVDRDGTARVIDPDWPPHVGDLNFSSLSLSPTGDRLVISIPEAATLSQLWVKTLDTGPLPRVTLEGTGNRRAVWSADGQSLTFVSARTGRQAIWTKRADGSGEASLVYEAEDHIEEFSYSLDGSWLAFRMRDAQGEDDVFVLRPATDSVPVPIAVTDFVERAPRVSPDGRWLAYTSNESGRDEIYVRSLTDEGSGRPQVSANGGTEPVWARRELFYRDGADRLVAVPVPEGPSSGWNEQEVLFSMSPYQAGNRHPAYDVTPDGQRFVMLRFEHEDATSQVVLVVNWFTELLGRMGGS